MTINTIKTFFIIFIFCNLFSCNGQVESEKKATELTRVEIGKLVSNLDSRIWKVYQDREGNYWFGSNGKGIYHFDGKLLKQFTTNDGLVDDTIRGIQEDNKGNIFIETPAGVSKYDGEKFTTLEIISSPDNQWKLEQNDLWFNCNGNANHVYRFDGEKIYELQLPQKNIKEILGIYESGLSYSPYTVFGIDKDRSGNLWLGTVLAGAFRFDGESFLWIGERELSRLPDGREPGVRSILEDKEGNIWLSNFQSKYKIKQDSIKKYEKQKAVELSKEITNDDIIYFNSGLVDESGNLWMTTYGGGVWKYDGETLSRIEVSNDFGSVLLISIYEDSKGVLWLGTDNDGVYRQNENNFEKFKP